jgi:hypothetical protein
MPLSLSMPMPMPLPMPLPLPMPMPTTESIRTRWPEQTGDVMVTAGSLLVTLTAVAAMVGVYIRKGHWRQAGRAGGGSGGVQNRYGCVSN